VGLPYADYKRKRAGRNKPVTFPEVKLNTYTTEARPDEVDECSCLRLSPSIRRPDDRGDARFVVVCTEVKDAVINADA